MGVWEYTVVYMHVGEYYCMGVWEYIVSVHACTLSITVTGCVSNTAVYMHVGEYYCMGVWE